jgi:hypothetical protein
MAAWLPLRLPAEQERERARDRGSRPRWSLVNAVREISPEISVIYGALAVSVQLSRCGAVAIALGRR